MRKVYFNPNKNLEKVCFTITDKSVDELKELKIIPKFSKTLELPVLERKDMSDAEKVGLDFPELVKFKGEGDNLELVVDEEKVRVFLVELLREARVEKLEELDSLQLRGLVQNNTEVIKEIEEDKEILRNLTANCFYVTSNNPIDSLNHRPIELVTDYRQKYESKL